MPVNLSGSSEEISTFYQFLSGSERCKRHYFIIAIPSLSSTFPPQHCPTHMPYSHASLPASTSFITPTARPSGRVLAFASLLIASMLASCPPPVASELTGSRCRCRCRCYFASLSPPTLHCLLLPVPVLCYVVCCAIANEQGLRCWHPCANASGWLRHHKAESLLAPPSSASARPLHLLCHPWLRLLCYSFPRLSPCLPTAPLPLPPLLLLVHTRSIPLSHHASPSAAYACQHQHTAECLLLQACSSPLCVPVNLAVNGATATAAAVVAVPNAAGVTIRRRGGRDDGMGGGRRAAQCR